MRYGMMHRLELRVSLPWTTVYACARCGLVVVNSDARNAISFMRPPPAGEGSAPRWYELEPPPGSARHATPFVASAPLRESPACEVAA